MRALLQKKWAKGILYLEWLDSTTLSRGTNWKIRLRPHWSNTDQNCILLSSQMLRHSPSLPQSLLVSNSANQWAKSFTSGTGVLNLEPADLCQCYPVSTCFSGCFPSLKPRTAPACFLCSGRPFTPQTIPHSWEEADVFCFLADQILGFSLKNWK